MEPEAVEWLWPRRVPFGKVTAFDGDPGMGESTVALDLAAREGGSCVRGGRLRWERGRRRQEAKTQDCCA